jgi:hypothetical protein
MTPSRCLFAEKRALKTKAGGTLVIAMDLYDISPSPVDGLFLERFRLSWIAFDFENPDKKVLVDSHPPVGLHYHFDNGDQIKLELTTLDEALMFFETKVIEHFGEIEGRIYADFYI